MLDTITQFFNRHLLPDSPGSSEDSAHSIRLALAVLLVEVAASDFHEAPEEKTALLSVIREAFELDASEADELIALAEQEHRESTDYFQFTSLINRSYDANQKIELIELLWKIAYADQELHRYEEHVIRRLSDLIHVPHSQFIAAKHRVQKALDIQ